MEFKEPPKGVESADKRSPFLKHEKDDMVHSQPEKKGMPKDPEKFDQLLSKEATKPLEEMPRAEKVVAQPGEAATKPGEVIAKPEEIVAGLNLKDPKDKVVTKGEELVETKLPEDETVETTNVPVKMDPTDRAFTIVPENKDGMVDPVINLTALGEAATKATASIIPKEGVESAGNPGSRLGPVDVKGADIRTIAANLADQIVVVVQQKDLVETAVTIKNIPMFENATLTLKEFASAKGEFNVSFNGLSEGAMNLLEINKDALRATAADKGIPLHIITTSMEQENRTTAQSSREGKFGDDRDEGQQGRGKQKKRGG